MHNDEHESAIDNGGMVGQQKANPGSPNCFISKFCRSADLYVMHDIKMCMSARLNGTVGKQKSTNNNFYK